MVEQAGIIKENTDMKKKIIQEAKAMFLEKGYDNVSVNGLLEKMGIAKGTFYHYFESKESLLNSVVQDFSDATLQEINSIVAQDIDAFKKLSLVLSVGRQRKYENMGLLKMLMAAMYRPENLVLRQRIMQASVSAASTVLTGIIKQGEKEGIFNTVGAEYAGFIIMNIGVALSDAMVGYVLKKEKTPDDDRRMLEMSETFDRSVARILGIEEGKVAMMDREFLRALK